MHLPSFQCSLLFTLSNVKIVQLDEFNDPLKLTPVSSAWVHAYVRQKLYFLQDSGFTDNVNHQVGACPHQVVTGLAYGRKPAKTTTAHPKQRVSTSPFSCIVKTKA